jgi:hypothetical protein
MSPNKSKSEHILKRESHQSLAVLQFCRTLRPELCETSGSPQVCCPPYFFFWNIIHIYKNFERSVRRLKANTFAILFVHLRHPVPACFIRPDQCPQIDIVPSASRGFGSSSHSSCIAPNEFAVFRLSKLRNSPDSGTSAAS